MFDLGWRSLRLVAGCCGHLSGESVSVCVADCRRRLYFRRWSGIVFPKSFDGRCVT